MPSSAAQRVTAPDESKLILVAEDNPINQRLALHILKSLGYRAEVVDNGSEAVNILSKEHFDAILMDLHMPVMDGIEATRIIRQLPGPLAQTPIIALTASTIEGQRQACLAAGMNDFLAKPIDRQQFSAALHHWTAAPPDSPNTTT